jgi:hypothetical protein
MMLGSLAVERQMNPGLRSSSGDIDERGVALSTIIDAINGFSPIGWQETSGHVHLCNPKELMQPTIKAIREEARLLKLSDFQH